MRGCLLTIAVFVILSLSGSIFMEAAQALRLDGSIVARSAGIGITIGLIIVAAPSYVLGWRARANKTYEDNQTKIDKQREADLKLG